jgi:hypothetical protein
MTDVDRLYARVLALPRGPRVPWFLDVDGVLNIDGPAPPLNDWPSYRHGLVSTSRETAVPFVWAPDVIDCINLLVRRGQVQVRWLTSWQLDAPLCAAPMIGLNAGRLVADPDDVDDARWWKLRVVQRFAEAGDFGVWTDDYLDEALGTAAVQRMTGGKVLAVCPDGRRGLTPQHLHRIVDAIAALRITAGLPAGG